MAAKGCNRSVMGGSGGSRGKLPDTVASWRQTRKMKDSRKDAKTRRVDQTPALRRETLPHQFASAPEAYSGGRNPANK